MKKIYEKPKAEYIAFYSDEEIASNLPLAKYANSEGGGGIIGGSGGFGDGGEDWEIN